MSNPGPRCSPSVLVEHTYLFASFTDLTAQGRLTEAFAFFQQNLQAFRDLSGAMNYTCGGAPALPVVLDPRVSKEGASRVSPIDCAIDHISCVAIELPVDKIGTMQSEWAEFGGNPALRTGWVSLTPGANGTPVTGGATATSFVTVGPNEIYKPGMTVYANSTILNATGNFPSLYQTRFPNG